MNNFTAKYLFMDAMGYEFLIRRVYHCGRHGVKGADADVYRKLEKAEINLTNVHLNKTREEKEHDYNTAFAAVRMYVGNAFREGIKQVQHMTTKEEMDKLEGMQAEVNSISFYTKKRIDEIIGEADGIFRKHGLEAR
jgi:hypothetical protein